MNKEELLNYSFEIIEMTEEVEIKLVHQKHDDVGSKASSVVPLPAIAINGHGMQTIPEEKTTGRVDKEINQESKEKVKESRHIDRKLNVTSMKNRNSNQQENETAIERREPKI